MPAQVNQADIDKLVSVCEKIAINIQAGVPDAAEKLLDSANGIARENTHKISGTLANGWKVVRTVFNITLENEVGYAEEEFSRPGIKRTIGTVHNVLPELNDFVNNNIEAVVNNALMNGLPR